MKKKRLDEALSEARANPGRVVLLFQDEGTFYRQPSQAWLWSFLGRRQPSMPYSHRSNTRTRVVGYLNSVTGAVHGEQMSVVSVRRLAKNVAKLTALYPQAEKLYLVWDNWPNHYHPLVAEALARQPKLQIVPLPAYSPWLNPIEKFWRWLRQRVTHAHPWCDDFLQFKDRIRSEMEALANGSSELVRYAGLSI